MSLLRLQRKLPAWYIELPLLIGGYVAFGLIRAAVDRGEPAATNNIGGEELPVENHGGQPGGFGLLQGFVRSSACSASTSKTSWR